MYVSQGIKSYLQSLAHATTDHQSFNTLLDDFFKVSWLNSGGMLRVRRKNSSKQEQINIYLCSYISSICSKTLHRVAG